jgi:putative Holliday junction resolvase
MPNYLGLDFGMKSIGVAVGQMVTRQATALQAIKANQGIPRWEALDSIIQEWQPQALIVGLPLNMDGSEQWITEHARAFMQQLSQRYSLAVHSMDERLSTYDAKKTLYQQQKNKPMRKQQIDATAAKIILETWMAENKTVDNS